jgi:hypothetical protein
MVGWSLGCEHPYEDKIVGEDQRVGICLLNWLFKNFTKVINNRVLMVSNGVRICFLSYQSLP